MGTRADFYVGKGLESEWLGSIAFDGYPSGIDGAILAAENEQSYRAAVSQFLASVDHATLPDHGWPWPWNDGRLTDYSYTFADDKVWYTSDYQPKRWLPSVEPELDEDADDYVERRAMFSPAEFPDMSARKNVNFGKGSGILFFRG